MKHGKGGGGGKKGGSGAPSTKPPKGVNIKTTSLANKGHVKA